MAEPVQKLNRKERRRDIVNGAMKVFADKNYQNATMSEIASEAGISEALIYKHFRSKRDLFLAALDDSALYLKGEFSKIIGIADKVGPVKAIKNITLLFGKYLRDNPSYGKLLLVAAAEAGDPVIKKALAKNISDARADIKSALEMGAKMGVLKPGLDIEALSWFLVGSYHVMALFHQTGHLKELNENIISGVLDPILSA